MDFGILVRLYSDEYTVPWLSEQGLCSFNGFLGCTICRSRLTTVEVSTYGVNDTVVTRSDTVMRGMQISVLLLSQGLAKNPRNAEGGYLRTLQDSGRGELNIR